MASVEERARVLGNPKLLAMLDQMKATIKDNNGELFQAKQFNNSFASGAVSGFNTMAQSLISASRGATTWAQAIRDVHDAFLKFASDFLLKIADMILQQAILNALGGANSSSSFGGAIASGMNGLFSSGTSAAAIAGAIAGAGGWTTSVVDSSAAAGGASTFGWLASIFHDGGVAGDPSAPSRLVSPGWFTNAMSYHSGGVAGLQPGEIPAILKRGEPVDPGDGSVFGKLFGGKAGGGGNSSPANVRVVNTFDAGDFMSQGASTRAGEQAILNVIHANRGRIKSTLGMS